MFIPYLCVCRKSMSEWIPSKRQLRPTWIRWTWQSLWIVWVPGANAGRNICLSLANRRSVHRRLTNCRIHIPRTTPRWTDWTEFWSSDNNTTKHNGIIISCDVMAQQRNSFLSQIKYKVLIIQLKDGTRVNPLDVSSARHRFTLFRDSADDHDR